MQSDEKSSLSEQLLLGEVNYDAEGMEALPMACLLRFCRTVPTFARKYKGIICYLLNNHEQSNTEKISIEQ
jgi:hypothetical protein